MGVTIPPGLPSQDPSLQWRPNWVCNPGAILREVLSERRITQATLAKNMGRSAKSVNLLVSGRVALTPSTALLLEECLNISAEFWMALEARYQLTFLRLALGSEAPEGPSEEIT